MNTKDNMMGGAYLLLMISQLAAHRVGPRAGHFHFDSALPWPAPARRVFALTHAPKVPGSAEFWAIFTRIEQGMRP